MEEEWVDVIVTRCKGTIGEWSGHTLLQLNLPINITKGNKLNLRLLIECLTQKLTPKEWKQFLLDNELQQLKKKAKE